MVGTASPGWAAASDKAKGNGPDKAAPAPAAGGPSTGATPSVGSPAAKKPATPPAAAPAPAPSPKPAPAPAPKQQTPAAKPAPKQSTSSGSMSTTSGNKNAGCHQTPYGSTGNGANHGGDYDDSCDGSGSLNGNGGGAAKGKPCAGCVGKADEKNPHGQRPNGPTDKNKGYECDGNKGIGRGNPAHTPCKDPVDPEEPCVPTQTNPCQPCVPTEADPCTTPVCVPSPTVMCGVSVLPRTLARTTGSTPPPGTEVLGRVHQRPTTAAAPGALAFTGSNPLGPALLGGLLLALGSVLTVVGRRRRPALR